MKLNITLLLLLLSFNCFSQQIIKKINVIEFEDFMLLRTYFNEKRIYFCNYKNMIGFKIEDFYILIDKNKFDKTLYTATRYEWDVRASIDMDVKSSVVVYSLIKGDKIKFNVLEKRAGKYRLVFTFLIRLKDLL